MFERVYGPHSGASGSGSTLLSLGLHAAALGVVVALGSAHVSEVVTTLNEGIIFLAPPPSAAARPDAGERVVFAEVPGLGGDALEAGILDGALGTEVGTMPPSGGERSGVAGEDDDGEATAEQLADSVYQSWQVENPAAFDPRSAAPAYPDSLRVAGVEGAVIAQFVVDTLGRVERGSFVLLESSHGRFTESVRRALPNMLFRPAEMNGRKIKQLVQLPFVFRLALTDTTGAAGPEAPDSAAATDSALRRGPPR